MRPVLSIASSTSSSRLASFALVRRFCWLLILLLAVPLFAQPQAPVTWGERRWIDLPFTQWVATVPLMPNGDTLLMAGGTGEGLNGWHNYTAYSFDNGRTTSPWQSGDTTWGNQYGRPAGFLAAAGPYAYRGYWWDQYSDHNYGWVDASSDGGATWQRRTMFSTALTYMALFATGQDVYLFEHVSISDSQGYTGVSVSTNGGMNWVRDQVVDSSGLYYYETVGDGGVGATRNWILVGGSDGMNYGVTVARRARVGGLWSSFAPVADGLYGYPGKVWVLADTTSDTAAVMSGLMLVRTTDGGATWAAPVNFDLDNHSYSIPSRPFCRGKLWGFAFNNQDGDHHSLYLRLSANHGKNWYPAQRADSVYSAFIGQFTGNEVRLYGVSMPFYPPDYDTLEFRTYTGQIQADTLPPMLQLVQGPNDSTLSGGTIHFIATARDNDTLSEVRVKIVLPDSAELSLTAYRTNQDTFAMNLGLPEAGIYRCRIEAEDFWENVSTLPDTGWYWFHTRSLNGTSSRILPPSSFSLSSFPNPFNSTARISFSLPKAGRADVRVYDITGRLVSTLADQRFDAGEHEVQFDGEGIASGIYLVRMEAGGMSWVQKMVLLK